MDKILRRYIIPIGILVVGSFLITFLSRNFVGLVNNTMYYFLITLMLFAFGFSLNNHRRNLNSFTWRHIIIILLLVFMFLYDTKILDIKIFNWIRKYIIAEATVIKVFYVYFGWLFVEK